MKTKQLSVWLFAALFGTVCLQSCSKASDEKPDSNNQFPERLTLDIPAELSTLSNTKSATVAADEKFDGKAMYANLRMFIGIAHGGAAYLDAMMNAIRVHKLNQPLDLEYADKDDNGRVKHLFVKEDQRYAGTDYRFGLSVTDVADENAGDGLGLQIFWSGNPVKGVAIIKQKHLDHANTNLGNAIIMIEYTEAPISDYDATMVVSIADLDLKSPSEDKFSADRIKLFVGKKGSIYDLYGNSNHPNAYFGTKQPAVIGLNYAFIASADDANKRAVAEIGLPPMSLQAVTKSEIIDAYTVRKVLVEAVSREFNLSLQETENSEAFKNAVLNIDPPAFFANSEIVATGTAPSADYDSLLVRKNTLSPFSPKIVSSMNISFGR